MDVITSRRMVLPVGTLYFYWAQDGRIVIANWAHAPSALHLTVFLARQLCRNVLGILLYKFARIFLEDLSGHISHKNEEIKSCEKIREANLAAQK